MAEEEEQQPPLQALVNVAVGAEEPGGELNIMVTPVGGDEDDENGDTDDAVDVDVQDAVDVDEQEEGEEEGEQQQQQQTQNNWNTERSIYEAARLGDLAQIRKLVLERGVSVFVLTPTTTPTTNTRISTTNHYSHYLSSSSISLSSSLLRKHT